MWLPLPRVTHRRADGTKAPLCIGGAVSRKADWGIVNPSVMAKGHDTSPKALRALGEALVGAFDGNTQAARPYGELGSTKQSSGPSGPAGPVPYHRATYHTKEFIP